MLILVLIPISIPVMLDDFFKRDSDFCERIEFTIPILIQTYIIGAYSDSDFKSKL